MRDQVNLGVPCCLQAAGDPVSLEEVRTCRKQEPSEKLAERLG